MSPLLLAVLVGIGAVGIYLAASGQTGQLISQSAGGNFVAALTGNLNASQIAQFAAVAGFQGDDLANAVAVALAESGGNPGAVGDVSLAPNNGPSQGLWQINIGAHAHPEYNDGANFDPQTNANRAFAVYSAAGNSFRPWSTFTGGQYLTFLPQAQAAVTA